MFYLLAFGIECISSILFVIPAIIVLQYVILRQHDFVKFMKVFIFALYFMAVISVTGIPAFGNFEIFFNFNFIPFVDVVNSPDSYIKNEILNVILFIPLGLLVPAIWENYRSFRKTTFVGFAVSVTIELLQIFSFRCTDIDDLITNTAGTVIGYYLSKSFFSTFTVKLSDNNSDDSNMEFLLRYEPVIILIITLLIGIFLKPYVADNIWEFVILCE